MDVSTRGGRGAAARAAASGVRDGLATAAWLAPTLLPLGIVQALLVAAPWLESLEALSQERISARATDWVMHDRLEAVMVATGGSPGLLVSCGLITVAWLVIVRARGPLRRDRRPAARVGDHRHHALQLLAWLLGAAACLLVQAAGAGVDRLVDIVTSLRATGPMSLALLVGSQCAPFVALGALLGATLALARAASAPWPVRAGHAALLVALAIIAIASQLASAELLAERFDVRRRLATALPPTEPPRPITVLVLARDRSWRLPMNDGVRGVRCTPETARAAEALHAARDGWSVLADDAERLVIAERLLALDPEGARRVALRLALRRGHPATSQSLLVSLGSAKPSAEARQTLDAVESSPGLHLGPEGMHLIAHAHGRLGDRARAERALARLRGHEGERHLLASRTALPLVLSTFDGGRVRGRLVVNGAPWRGRVGLVATRDLFRFPASGDDVPVTWLLRLVDAVPAAPDGAFVFQGLPEGEMALVLALPGSPPELVATRQPLPRIEVDPARPDCGLGEIRLTAASATTPVTTPAAAR